MVRDPDDSARGVGLESRRKHVGHLVVTAVSSKDLVRDPVCTARCSPKRTVDDVSGFFGSRRIPPMGKILASWRHPRFTVLPGYRRRGDFRHSAFLRWQTGGGDSDYPLPVMGGVSLLLYGVIGASRSSRIDQIESTATKRKT